MKSKVISEQIVSKKYGVKNRRYIISNTVSNFLKKWKISGDKNSKLGKNTQKKNKKKKLFNTIVLKFITFFIRYILLLNYFIYCLHKLYILFHYFFFIKWL